MLRKIQQYFDLTEPKQYDDVPLYLGPDEEIQPQEQPMSLVEQLLLYVGCVLGVLFSSTVQSLPDDPLLSFSLSSFAVAAVIALAVAPQAYKKLKIEKSTPILFRIGLFVQQGVFWHVLIGAAGAVTS